jgi:hypothetical protein
MDWSRVESLRFHRRTNPHPSTRDGCHRRVLLCLKRYLFYIIGRIDAVGTKQY